MMIRFKKYKCPCNDECCYSDLEEPCMYCGVSFDDSQTIWYKLYIRLPYWLRDNTKSSTWKRRCRFFIQRHTRGWDDSDLWNLDYTCAKLMAPRIRLFIDKYGDSFVPSKMDETTSLDERSCQWKEILEKICKAFDLIVKSDSDLYSLEKSERQEIEEGLDLFREWYFHLWS